MICIGDGMEKKMFQKIVKDRLKIEGFKIKGNNSYKLLGKDYLIGVMLDHNPYCRGYFIEYGVVYLPDESKFPFQGFCKITVYAARSIS